MRRSITALRTSPRLAGFPSRPSKVGRVVRRSSETSYRPWVTLRRRSSMRGSDFISRHFSTIGPATVTGPFQTLRNVPGDHESPGTSSGYNPWRVVETRKAMSEPLSFVGTGEVVEQVREFVKDLRGRNRQERRMAQLAIEREHVQLQKDKLDLAREYLSTLGLVPPNVLSDLGLEARDGAAGVVELELERRLELEAGPTSAG